MSEIDREIAEIEATLKHLKKLRGNARKSAARKAAWAEKYEQDMRPKQRRETRKCLPPVPRDPFEALLFGGGAR